MSLLAGLLNWRWPRILPELPNLEKIGQELSTNLGNAAKESVALLSTDVKKDVRETIANAKKELETEIQKVRLVLNKSLRVSDRILEKIDQMTKDEKYLGEVLMTGTIQLLKNVVFPLAVAGLLYKGSSLGVQYMYDRAVDDMTKPKLAQKTKTITWTTPIHEYLFGVKKKEAPILNEELTKQIQEIVLATKNIKKNKGFFQNVMLDGPGGTGKTMLAEMIAEESGLNYVMMSGGELAQFIKSGKHVGEFNKFWDFAESSSVPTIVFIDEAESLCKHRWLLDQEHMELLNAFLARTGTPSSQVMIILATNLPDYIDEAVLNRMTHQITVKEPGLSERLQIIWKYILQFFTDAGEREALFPGGMKNPQIQYMARETEGFTGRSLIQMVNALHSKKGTTEDNKLTPEMVKASVDKFIIQKRKLKQETSNIGERDYFVKH